MLPSVLKLQQSLAKGELTALELTTQVLERTLDKSGQGDLVFTRVYQDQALAAAKASDALRAAGIVRSPLEGIPISIKDLFDVVGEPTCAGSRVLKDAPPATSDAVIVQYLRRAGAIITGKVNMVEFAYSGLGLNPHYGTPHSPWDSDSKRIPGGSSSGSGVAVAEDMSVVSIGTDTGGSIRIPSAYCGLTGFKPTASRISSVGALPLSTSLDSIGGLCTDVTDCVIVDDIISGSKVNFSQNEITDKQKLLENSGVATNRSVAGLRFLIPETLVFDGVDEHVNASFNRAISVLKGAGANIFARAIPQFNDLIGINSKGGFAASEAWAWHRELLAEKADLYDPRVSSRIIKGKDMLAADYIDLLNARQQWIKSVEQEFYGYDAVLMPTVPIIAPKIADLEQSDKAYFKTNGLILRNPTLINFLNGCALSLPCHQAGAAPVGLMVAGTAMQDKKILGIGLGIEALLQQSI